MISFRLVLGRACSDFRCVPIGAKKYTDDGYPQAQPSTAAKRAFTVDAVSSAGASQTSWLKISTSGGPVQAARLQPPPTAGHGGHGWLCDADVAQGWLAALAT